MKVIFLQKAVLDMVSHLRQAPDNNQSVQR